MSPRVPPLRPNELIATLTRHRVDFVVIGGIAAVLQGAPYTTFDLDIVYARDDGNLRRLATALDELGATILDPGGRVIGPDRPLLEAPGPKLLHTSLGRLDLLGELDERTTWEELVADSVALPFRSGHVRVLRLERVVEAKERLGRPKDLAALPLLRATLARGAKGASGE